MAQNTVPTGLEIQEQVRDLIIAEANRRNMALVDAAHEAFCLWLGINPRDYPILRERAGRRAKPSGEKLGEGKKRRKKP